MIALARPFGALAAVALLVACDRAPSATFSSAAATGSTSAARAASSASGSPRPVTTLEATTASTVSVVGSAAVATASASAGANGPCPEGARKDDEARYCITLPPKYLGISYEGDSPSKGIREELEIAGDRLILTVGPVPAGVNLAQLQADAAAKPEHVDGGALEHGCWNDRMEGRQHIVESVVVGRYLVTCMFWVRDEKNLEMARAVCKSVKTF